MSAAFLKGLLEEEEDDFPSLVSQQSMDLQGCSTPPITGWLDVSLEMSPPGEVSSIIPFVPLSDAVNANLLKTKLEEVEGADDFNVAPKKKEDARVDRVQMNPLVREINRLIDRNFEEINSPLILSQFYMLGSLYNSLKDV